MLWYRGETLIQEVFQAEVIRLDQKGAAPKIWTPVSDRLNQVDQLPFVNCQLGVPWHEWPTEEHSLLIPSCHNLMDPEGN
jgi:hypothetical protein